MGRSKWKSPHSNALVTNKNASLLNRNLEIMPKHFNKHITISNGSKYKEVIVTESMVGHKFGEFFFTRKKFSFKK